MSRVELTAEAKEDLRDLDGSEQKVVVKALRKLETEPRKRGQPLGSHNSGNLSGFRKLVVGDRQYRIVFQVVADDQVVVVWVIAERTDDRCYQLAVARLATFQNREVANELSELITDMFESAASSNEPDRGHR